MVHESVSSVVHLEAATLSRVLIHSTRRPIPPLLIPNHKAKQPYWIAFGASVGSLAEKTGLEESLQAGLDLMTMKGQRLCRWDRD